MATYSELAGITADSGWNDFASKIRVACVIKATAIVDAAAPGQGALDWAKDALNNPTAAARGVIWYVIGANDNASIATILSASDSAIQTNVNAAVDALEGT